LSMVTPRRTLAAVFAKWKEVMIMLLFYTYGIMQAVRKIRKTWPQAK